LTGGYQKESDLTSKKQIAQEEPGFLLQSQGTEIDD